jgi:hypothetical protein
LPGVAGEVKTAFMFLQMNLLSGNSIIWIIS